MQRRLNCGRTKNVILDYILSGAKEHIHIHLASSDIKVKHVDKIRGLFIIKSRR